MGEKGRGGPASLKIRLGDHLSRVAATWGFRSYAPLWNDFENNPLRHRRANPNILGVDDPVHVPVLELREVDRPTEQRHRFKAEILPLVARFEFKTWLGKPIEAAPKTVSVDGRPVEFKNPGPGKVEVPVTALSDRCAICFPDTEVTGRVGFLQPVATVAGYRERLNNLGYQAGASDDVKEIELRSAIEEFQCDQHLAVDGKCGPVTQSRLAAVYGC